MSKRDEEREEKRNFEKEKNRNLELRSVKVGKKPLGGGKGTAKRPQALSRSKEKKTASARCRQGILRGGEAWPYADISFSGE